MAENPFEHLDEAAAVEAYRAMKRQEAEARKATRQAKQRIRELRSGWLQRRRERLATERRALTRGRLVRLRAWDWVRWKLGLVRWRCETCGERKPLEQIAQYGGGVKVRCRACMPGGGVETSAGGSRALPAGMSIDEATAASKTRARVQQVLARRLQQRRR